VAFVGVRSSSTDTDEATRAYLKENGFAIPVLADDGNVLADYFRVPNFMVFVVIDGEGRMRFWGGIDDHPDETRVKRRHLREAIDAVLAGKSVERKQAYALG
jgi:hypothetical protein